MADTDPTTTPADSSAAPMTAPGAAMTVPQEQIDRYAELVLHVMQLRNWVELHRARLPADLVARWEAWQRGLAQVLQQGQTDQLALRRALAEVPAYRVQLGQYRDAFASHGAPAAATTAAPREQARGGMSPLLIGGGGLAVGLLLGFFVGGGR